jgi:S1-C subfamily serine protease
VAVLAVPAALAGPALAEANPGPDLTSGVVVLRTANTLGTGFFVGGGTILTANHVLGDSDEVAVVAGEHESTGTVVRRNTTLDLAVVRTSLEGQARQMRGTAPVIGEEARVVGAAAGSLSMTRGIVSGFRELDGVRYIQTDAAINGGNSGGPLFDSDGKVLGVVVSKLPDSEGIGLAVPANAVRSFLAEAPDSTPTTQPSQGRQPATDAGPERSSLWWLALPLAMVLALFGSTMPLGRRRPPAITVTESDLQHLPFRPDTYRKEQPHVNDGLGHHRCDR